MTSYMDEHRTAARKTVQFTQRDLDDLQKLRDSAAKRQALSELARADVTEGQSEAAFLHALIQAGIRAVQDQQLADSYAAEAAAMTEQEHDEGQRIARRRRRLDALDAE